MELAQVDHGQPEHQHQADAEAHHLARRPGLHAAVGRRIEHGEAEPAVRISRRSGPTTHGAELLRDASAPAGPKRRVQGAHGQTAGSVPARRRRARCRPASAGLAPLGLAQHVARDRRRRVGAAAAVLDHDRAGIARLLDRGKGDEQRVVALGPGHVLDLQRWRRARPAVMRRTWAVPVLPAISMPGSSMRAAIGRAVVGIVDDPVHALVHHGRDAARCDAERLELAAAAVAEGRRASRGVTAAPPLAMRAAMTPSCSGVVST